MKIYILIFLVLCSVVNAADNTLSDKFKVVTLDGLPAPENVAKPQGDKDNGYLLQTNQVPTLTISLTKQKPSRGTVLICPGGGYNGLAGHEGVGVIPFFNDLGYDAAVLYYHVRCGKETKKMALEDALKAWSLINTKVKELGLSDKQLAVIGFSAGGHLSAALTQALGKAVLRQPDRLILCYPAYLEQKDRQTGELAVQPPEKPTGKLCVIISPLDNKSWVDSSKVYADAWSAAGGESQYNLVVTENKSHGFGMRHFEVEANKAWPDLLVSFMK